MKIQIILFVTIILSTCKSSFLGLDLSLDKLPILCKIKNVAVSVSPSGITDLINFITSLKDEFQFFKNSVAIESQIIKEAFSEPVAYNEDQYLNITALITKYGFTPEVHEVTTEDGYELTMHRIVGNGPVVFIMHGFLCSSDDWITSGANALPYMLASEGYDIWLGNARGNKHSMKHVSLSPECGEFWEFGWDEISLIDVPSMINYALNVTGKANLAYVGHSQGSTNLLALCSEMPEYNNKISLAALLAPAAYQAHNTSPIIRFVYFNPEAVYKVSQLLGLNNLTPNDEIKNLITGIVCGNNAVSKILCGNILNMVFGYGKGQLNITNLPVILSHFPSGSSVRQIVHFGQVARTGKFRKFDFTNKKNLEVYGSEEPPEYPLNKVTVPVASFYAEFDWIVNITDVNQLHDKLPNVVYTKFLYNYSHADFLFAKTANEYLYKPVIELIKEYLK